MNVRRLVSILPHTVVLVVLLLAAMFVIRVVAGGPLPLAEIGAGVLIALAYPRVLSRLGYSVSLTDEEKQ